MNARSVSTKQVNTVTATIEFPPPATEGDPAALIQTAFREMQHMLETCTGDRKSYVGVLMYTAKFLNTLQQTSGVEYPNGLLGDPLVSLAMSFHDLEFGVAPSFLRPKPGNGKSSQHWLSRAYSALALECYHGSGQYENLDAAAQALAMTREARSAELDWKKLKIIRDEFSAPNPRHKNELALSSFRGDRELIARSVGNVQLLQMGRLYMKRALQFSRNS
jgi:hypothetical protein